MDAKRGFYATFNFFFEREREREREREKENILFFNCWNLLVDSVSQLPVNEEDEETKWVEQKYNALTAILLSLL